MSIRALVGMLKSRILITLGVRKNVVIGNKFHVGPGSVIWAPSLLQLGHNVYVGKNVTIEVDGLIGDEVLIANAVGLVGRRDHDHRQIGVPIRSADWAGEHIRLSDPITIGSDVWIGYGAVILSGVRIGNSTVIAAGSVVTADIPDNSIAAGTPARVISPRMTDDQFREHWSILRAKGVRWIGKPTDSTSEPQ